ncbi:MULTISPECIES: hypothetical protein [unclassified Paenibacillus]|nr:MULTISPECIES: hypothetical protein [unclassified Paenibacillus]QID16053.1 hypothetical protein CIC07_25315 [Paenibacillus sp. RUD330]SIR11009.1 hypothetical protein SAMN05880555_3037 [Paenibacillus sp. RU4X]SIR25794.1 hypothetical protein SAMN05880570_2963 [Paenibacillus sp. RU4T]
MRAEWGKSEELADLLASGPDADQAVACQKEWIATNDRHEIITKSIVRR